MLCILIEQGQVDDMIGLTLHGAGLQYRISLVGRSQGADGRMSVGIVPGDPEFPPILGDCEFRSIIMRSVGIQRLEKEQASVDRSQPLLDGILNDLVKSSQEYIFFPFRE